MALPTSDFEYVRDLVYGASGIVLEQKEYLVESRLSNLVHQERLGDLGKLLESLRRANSAPLQRKVVDALTTNESLFFRDVHPFEALKKTILPELKARNAAKKQLRIWSAACSTGQEAFSIAMLISELWPQPDDWKIEILGTDISDRVLEQARSGTYNQLEVNRGLPVDKLIKYFEQVGTQWRLSLAIRRMARFEPMNLVGKWPARQPFDLVMLRNVMIYFDTEARKSILTKLAEQLTPGGYLFMGSGETPVALSDRFEVVPVGRTAAYRLKA